MNSPSDTFVSVDLETTGLDPRLHEIIEIGAVKVENGRVTAEFSELVKPRRPIPDAITCLTGIGDGDVGNAGTIDEIMPSFLDFIRGYRLLGQNVGFDVAFLRKAVGIGHIDTAIDTVELARILLPMLPSYNLDALIDFFGLTPGRRHRALDDARVTAEIFLKFVDMLRVVPVSFLDEMAAMFSKTSGRLGEIFEALLLERANEPKKRRGREVRDVSAMYRKSDNVFGDFSREPPASEPCEVPVDPDTVESLFTDCLPEVYEDYEMRPGQTAMARMVTRAFNESGILLAEAGTGIGKSMAYLIPAILWAEASRERVIVSTNTKNLQEQLFFKDIPLISRVLDFPFRAVILKGRGNYICIHRWERITRSPGRFLSRDERNLLPPVASWLLNTTTGDLSETGFFSMLVESGLLEKINSDSISCIGARCPSRETCFVTRIRRAAQQAHIVIVNHSLVFSDMVSDGAVLGSYSRLIFDEAHNIEKVALQYLGVSFSYYRVRRILNRLHARNGNTHGILAVLREWADEMMKGWPKFADNAATLDAVIELVDRVGTVTRELFECLNGAVLAETANAEGIHEGKLRYDENTPVFGACADAVEKFNEVVSMLISGIEDVKMLVAGVSLAQLKDREEIQMDLEKIQMDLQAVVDDFEFLITSRGRNVFWFEYNENGSAYSLKILSAPLDVAEKLSAGLYDHMETIVLTSATLTVARDFSYIRGRLGLDLDLRDRIVEFIAASPFDYRSQATVAVPSFLPSPKHERFIDRSNEVLLKLATSIGRGMLVLFTSRGHLHRSYHELRDPLARKGITLLAQGIDGSRNLILRRFREETRSILFGMDSFWEGVDVPGTALEIVVIARLPFSVPTEPIVQAQMEEIERGGGNPFFDYSIPETAIKLRQGAGRLIRRRNDRGVIVVLDTRIVTARYGEIFRRCFPCSFRKFESIDGMVGSIDRWFGEMT